MFISSAKFLDVLSFVISVSAFVMFAVFSYVRTDTRGKYFIIPFAMLLVNSIYGAITYCTSYVASMASINPMFNSTSFIITYLVEYVLLTLPIYVLPLFLLTKGRNWHKILFIVLLSLGLALTLYSYLTNLFIYLNVYSQSEPAIAINAAANFVKSLVYYAIMYVFILSFKRAQPPEITIVEGVELNSPNKEIESFFENE